MESLRAGDKVTHWYPSANRYEAVLDRWSEVAQGGDVVWAQSNNHTGMRHLPVRLRIRG